MTATARETEIPEGSFRGSRVLRRSRFAFALSRATRSRIAGGDVCEIVPTRHEFLRARTNPRAVGDSAARGVASGGRGLVELRGFRP